MLAVNRTPGAKQRHACRKDKTGRRRLAVPPDPGPEAPVAAAVSSSQEEQRVEAIWDNIRHSLVPAALRALTPDAAEAELPSEELCNVR